MKASPLHLPAILYGMIMPLILTGEIIPNITIDSWSDLVLNSLSLTRTRPLEHIMEPTTAELKDELKCLRRRYSLNATSWLNIKIRKAEAAVIRSTLKDEGNTNIIILES